MNKDIFHVLKVMDFNDINIKWVIRKIVKVFVCKMARNTLLLFLKIGQCCILNLP